MPSDVSLARVAFVAAIVAAVGSRVGLLGFAHGGSARIVLAEILPVLDIGHERTAMAVNLMVTVRLCIAVT